MNGVTNMAAKIDIDALKTFKNQELCAENWQKFKKASSTQDLPVLKKKSVFRLVHF